MDAKTPFSSRLRGRQGLRRREEQRLGIVHVTRRTLPSAGPVGLADFGPDVFRQAEEPPDHAGMLARGFSTLMGKRNPAVGRRGKPSLYSKS